jgi:hypothetical protein
MHAALPARVESSSVGGAFSVCARDGNAQCTMRKQRRQQQMGVRHRAQSRAERREQSAEYRVQSTEQNAESRGQRAQGREQSRAQHNTAEQSRAQHTRAQLAGARREGKGRLPHCGCVSRLCRADMRSSTAAPNRPRAFARLACCCISAAQTHKSTHTQSQVGNQPS